MNCDDVKREISVPTGVYGSDRMAEHLAACASCNIWAKRARQLDQVWDVTRPTEPGPEAWDSLWARVTSSLDQTPAKGFTVESTASRAPYGVVASEQAPGSRRNQRVRSRRRTLLTVGLIGLAQAATVLIAVGLTWNGSTRSNAPVIAGSGTPPHAAAKSQLAHVIEIDEGRLVVIQLDDAAVQVVDRTPEVAGFRLDKRLRNLESALVDDWLVMLNEVESMTKPLVAMQE